MMNESSEVGGGPPRSRGTEHGARTSSYWTRDRLSEAASTLARRAANLREDIVRELRKLDDETSRSIADNVADSAELSVADVIGDLYLAEVDRDVRDLREVEAALLRIRADTYGTCVDCAEPVDPMRLRFNPQAARCLHCQESNERALGGRLPTL
jgi:DnaK suppressor protein